MYWFLGIMRKKDWLAVMHKFHAVEYLIRNSVLRTVRRIREKNRLSHEYFRKGFAFFRSSWMLNMEKFWVKKWRITETMGNTFRPLICSGWHFIYCCLLWFYVLTLSGFYVYKPSSLEIGLILKGIFNKVVERNYFWHIAIF